MGKCLFMRKGEVHTAPVGGILASDLAVGSTVKLMENGVAAEYLVVNQGIPSNSNLYDASCDGTWLLRKDGYISRNWATYSNPNNEYAKTDINTYLNGTFINVFDADTQNIIVQAKIPYVNGVSYQGAIASGANGLSVKAFLLGAYEIGLTQSNYGVIPIDGARLSYFENGVGTSAINKRVCQSGSNAVDWWLRSPSNGATTVCIIEADGSRGASSSYNVNRYVRPALILPSNALFDAETLILKGVA